MYNLKRIKDGQTIRFTTEEPSQYTIFPACETGQYIVVLEEPDLVRTLVLTPIQIMEMYNVDVDVEQELDEFEAEEREGNDNLTILQRMEICLKRYQFLRDEKGFTEYPKPVMFVLNKPDFEEYEKTHKQTFLYAHIPGMTIKFSGDNDEEQGESLLETVDGKQFVMGNLVPVSE